jgi:hypothetical protein
MKHMKNKDKERFTVSLDTDIAKQVREIAAEEDRLPANMIAILAKRAIMEKKNTP